MKKYIKITLAAAGFIVLFLISAFTTYTFLKNKDVTTIQDPQALLTAIKRSAPRAYVVQSGSMEPAIETGSLILSLPQDNYRSGEVITFERGNKLITHRAMYQEFTTGDSFFVTKGDANEESDTQKVAESNVVGKVVFSVPKAGYVADFAKTPRGFILLVIVPATIVIYEELKSLFKELLKVIRRMKNSNPLSLPLNLRGRTDEESSNEERDELGSLNSKIIKGMAIFPIFGAILVVSALSVSYFFDNERSIDNVFSASDTFEAPSPTPTGEVGTQLSPTPTPTGEPGGGVVINEVYYDTDASHRQPSNADDNDFEWIEIYNNGSTTVNLKDWKITDNSGTERTVSTSNRNLEPGQFAVLAKAANVFVQWSIPNEALKIQLGEIIGNGLANTTGDRVVLIDDEGNIIDQISYGNDTTILNPSIPLAGDGISFEREPTGTDTNTANDFVKSDPPTPGT